MRNMPRLVTEIPERQNAIVQMRGINYTDNYYDGSLSDSLNISSRRFPYFTTKRPRRKLDEYAHCTSMTSWNGLVVVQSGRLIYRGQDVGSVSPGAKQFAMIHDRLVIWPDKKYLDTNMVTPTLKNLAASASGSGATFTDKTITVTWPVNFTNLFKINDTIEISGCTTEASNNKYAKITAISAKVLTFQDNTFTACTEAGEFSINRRIPDLDYICESGSRLWGCSNAAETIYVSALDDPMNFYDFSGTADDSFQTEVSSEGDFTGCCTLGSAVLFFKENTIHKILGAYPAEYVLYSYAMEGVKAGCHKSIAAINETLFYMGVHGMYSYAGGTSSFLAPALGNHGYENAVAGTDGDNYYLSCEYEGETYFFTYSIKSGIWVREDDTRVIDFARIGKDEYLLADDGNIYLEDSGEESDSIPWSMTFNPFYESVSGSYNSSSSIYGHKRYSKIIMRTELPAGSWLKVEVREDNKPWKEVRKVAGQAKSLSRIVIPVGRCDRFELRLSGTGQFTLLNMLKEFRIGSDK